jgi:polyphosphate kinase 2
MISKDLLRGVKYMSRDEIIKKQKIDKKIYKKELRRLKLELIKLQEWIKYKGLKVVVIFEGRDAAGKGGVIKRISQDLNPRICHVAALGKPSEKEETQWYFQRYIPYLPGAGEMVLFDRSWYNCVGVDRVMGFTTPDQWEEFYESCPAFENMLIRSGIILIKFWFSVSMGEQERRFKSRLENPTKRWKLSPMDVKSRTHWDDYSKAKDIMFEYCDTENSPWFVVPADNKKAARLNSINHLLSMISYKGVPYEPVTLPEKQETGYIRPALSRSNLIPQLF